MADDDALLREGIASLLETVGHQVVGRARDATDLLVKVRSYAQDVAIVDVRIPPDNKVAGLTIDSYDDPQEITGPATDAVAAFFGRLTLFIGTTSGVLRLQDGALEPLGLDGHSVTALHASDGALLAGTYGDGLFRSADGGRTWEHSAAGLTASTLRFVSAELAGTEPARVYRSADGGESWTELDGITRIPGHEQWYLPYSPRAGAARNAYVSGDRLLVAAEVAGLLRSDDGGDTWVCEPVAGDEDVHHVTGHPDDPELVYVSLGSATLGQRGGQHGGIARSRDGGRTWEKVKTDYTRATIVPPARPDLLLAGPAPRVGRGGRIVVSADGGDSWEPAGHGIDVPMPDMVELFVAAPDGTIWAICSGGRLLRASPGDGRWSSPLPRDGAVSVKSVAFG